MDENPGVERIIEMLKSKFIYRYKTKFSFIGYSI